MINVASLPSAGAWRAAKDQKGIVTNVCLMRLSASTDQGPGWNLEKQSLGGGGAAEVNRPANNLMEKGGGSNTAYQRSDIPYKNLTARLTESTSETIDIWRGR